MGFGWKAHRIQQQQPACMDPLGRRGRAAIPGGDQGHDPTLVILAGRAPPGIYHPALWGGGYTFLNRVAGQPLFLVNPNSNIDPTQQLALNPKAWVEPPYGTFGASAPYFNYNRWQRQPGESMAFGRTFRVKERAQYQVRAESQNIFSRLFYSVPSTAG